MSADTSADLDLGITIRGFDAGQVVFGRYRLDRILGRGGMGVVWLAHDQELGEEVALKFLPEVVRLDAVALEELKRETRKSRKLTHRHIVRVHDFLSDAHCAGISMEWIDGPTLSALRLGRPHMVFEPEELKPWVRQMCEALEYAHGVAKLIHRDLKPANIMLSGAGEAKVTDFGISSSLTESASRMSAQHSSSGTLAYSSPQQALGARPSAADDVYSIGATIYELIACKPPFFRGDLYAQVRDVIPPPMAERRAEFEIPAGAIPEQWEKTVAACLAKDPAKRPQSAMEVAWMLGLAKEYERRATPEIPEREVIRVPKEKPDGASPAGSTAGPIASVPGELLAGLHSGRSGELLKKYSTSCKRFFAAALGMAAASGEAAPAAGSLGGATVNHPGKGANKPPAIAFVRAHPVQSAAGALALVLIVALIWDFSRMHPAYVAKNSAPIPAPIPTVTPLPLPANPLTGPTDLLPGTGLDHGAGLPTPATPPPVVPVVPAEKPAPTPLQPTMAPTPAPTAPETQAPSGVDRQLVGTWLTGTTRATRKRWELHSDGHYFLRVAGAITDSGTMSAADGAIQQFSKTSPQPFDVTYQFEGGNLETQGDGPVGEAEWHRLTAAATVVHHERSVDSDSHESEGGGHSILNNIRAHFGF